MLKQLRQRSIGWDLTKIKVDLSTQRYGKYHFELRRGPFSRKLSLIQQATPDRTQTGHSTRQRAAIKLASCQSAM